MSGEFHCFGRSAAGSQRISRLLEHSRTANSFLNLHQRTRVQWQLFHVLNRR